MKFKADEITSVIQQEIEQYRSQLEVSEVGRVLEVGDGIARVYGLSGAMAGEMVEFDSGLRGMALNLENMLVMSWFCLLRLRDRERERERLVRRCRLPGRHTRRLLKLHDPSGVAAGWKGASSRASSWRPPGCSRAR